MAAPHEAQFVEITKTFSTLIENLQLLMDQIKTRDVENLREMDPNFNLDSLWQRLGMTFKAVSIEATKLCMAFSQPPTPSAEESQPLIRGIEKSTLTMFSAFHSLPQSQGQVLHCQTQQAVLDVLEALKNLAEVIKTQGYHGEQHQLQSTGSVWQHCDAFPLLPKNNKDAVLVKARESLGLVKDALEEIAEAVTEQGPDDQHEEDEASWSDDDRKLLSASIGLLKTAKNSMKKITVAIRDHGTCSSEAEIKELDSLASILEQVSPAVDDLSLALYPPMQWGTVRENAQRLREILEELLQKSKIIHITMEEDAQWVEFLLKATTHNGGRVNELTSLQ